MQKRIAELDSLRGVAAMAVFCCHILLVFTMAKGSTESFIFNYTPFKLFTIGRAAVLLFFVLSGFALSALMESKPSYLQFTIRRLSRILLPLMGATAISLALYYLIGHHEITGLHEWISTVIWTEVPTHAAIVNQALATGMEKDKILGPATWTLVYELRISLLFPLFYWAGCRFPRATAAANIVLFFGAQYLIERYNISVFGSSDLVESSIAMALYIPFFVAGFFIYRYQDILRAKVFKVPRAANILLIAFLYFMLTDAHDLLRLIGVSFLLILAIRENMFARFLRRPACVFLGQISYSLYLLHILVMVALFQLFADYIGPVVLVALSVVIALPLAALFHKWVELPAIKFGRDLAQAASAPTPSIL